MLFSDPEVVIQDAMHRLYTGHNGACQQKKSFELFFRAKICSKKNYTDLCSTVQPLPEKRFCCCQDIQGLWTTDRKSYHSQHLQINQNVLRNAQPIFFEKP